MFEAIADIQREARSLPDGGRSLVECALRRDNEQLEREIRAYAREHRNDMLMDPLVRDPSH